MFLRKFMQNVSGASIRARTFTSSIPQSSVQIQTNLNPQKDASIVSNNPLAHEDYFGVRKLVSVEELFNARVHYGHRSGCRNQNMQPYIFGCRNDVDVINLEETHEHLIQALNFLSHIVYNDGIVLFLMHSHIHGHTVEKMALECGEFAHTHFYYRSLFLSPVENHVKLPNLCVFLSLLTKVNAQHPCILDCAKINIPTIGIADTNSDPSLVTYPVPGNDDTTQSIELYCHLLKTCVLRAKAKKREDMERTK